MAVKTMEDLFLHGIQDIYYAEKQITQALPKMAKAVGKGDLAEAFEEHVKETRKQIDRLEKVFANCKQKAKGTECPAIDGMIKETEEIMEETEDDDVLSAALLAGAQAVEHYEIARYGTLCEWAQVLGYDDSAKLLKETLAEEKNTDRKLTRLAEKEVNRRAAAS
jgi:ferritin-like metal-binding protein YciE